MDPVHHLVRMEGMSGVMEGDIIILVQYVSAGLSLRFVIHL